MGRIVTKVEIDPEDVIFRRVIQDGQEVVRRANAAYYMLVVVLSLSIVALTAIILVAAKVI